MLKTSVEKLIEVLTAKGYKVFDDGQLNLIGIRKDLTYNNRFDDTFVVFTTDGVFHAFDCTTDPGMYWVENFFNPDGTAVLKPGQYLNSHQRGLHQGSYPALVQRRALTVYRDDNRDNIIDYINPQTGLFGINIHRANANTKSVQVDKWSAGCTVIADPKDFATLMALANKSTATEFTYTLLEEDDFA